MKEHVYYFPEINKIFIITENNFCDQCPHIEILKWGPMNGEYYSGIFLGEL